MKNLTEYLTGYSESEFRRLGHDKSLRCCYRCHRTEKDKSAVITRDGVMPQRLKLLPMVVRFEEEGALVTIKYFLCIECYIEREGEQDKDGKPYPLEIFERE